MTHRLGDTQLSLADGITEYRATTFNSAIKGALFMAGYSAATIFIAALSGSTVSSIVNAKTAGILDGTNLGTPLAVRHLPGGRIASIGLGLNNHILAYDPFDAQAGTGMPSLPVSSSFRAVQSRSILLAPIVHTSLVHRFLQRRNRMLCSPRYDVL